MAPCKCFPTQIASLSKSFSKPENERKTTLLKSFLLRPHLIHWNLLRFTILYIQRTVSKRLLIRINFVFTSHDINFVSGNLLVILVVTLSRRLRSITNFFLANLAVADLCVGVFCVFQNLTIYLIPRWVILYLYFIATCLPVARCRYVSYLRKCWPLIFILAFLPELETLWIYYRFYLAHSIHFCLELNTEMFYL